MYQILSVTHIKPIQTRCITLPETNSSPLKMDGWKLEYYFPFGKAYFQELCRSVQHLQYLHIMRTIHAIPTQESKENILPHRDPALSGVHQARSTCMVSFFFEGRRNIFDVSFLAEASRECVLKVFVMKSSFTKIQVWNSVFCVIFEVWKNFNKKVAMERYTLPETNRSRRLQVPVTNKHMRLQNCM